MIELISPERRRSSAVAALVAGIFMALIGEGLLRLLPLKPLVVDDGSVHADAAIVLGGSSEDRPYHAADLYHQGLVKWVILSGKGDIDLSDAILREKGVPARVILQDPRSSSTMENAENSVALMEQHGLHSAVVVTSWYHSRRAMLVFSKFARPGMTFYSAPSYWGLHSKVKDQASVDASARYEYIKLLFYRVRYGIRLW